MAGYRIIADLLDVFVTALNNKFDGNQSNFDKLVLNLLPKEYQTETENLYRRIMQVCSYVSRMSVKGTKVICSFNNKREIIIFFPKKTNND